MAISRDNGRALQVRSFHIRLRVVKSHWTALLPALHLLPTASISSGLSPVSPRPFRSHCFCSFFAPQHPIPLPLLFPSNPTYAFVVPYETFSKSPIPTSLSPTPADTTLTASARRNRSIFICPVASDLLHCHLE